MDREQIIQTLGRHSAELRSLGVRSLDLFGSRSRGDFRTDSDVDLLADFFRPVTLFQIARVQTRLQEILGGISVDLVPRNCVPQDQLPAVQGDIIHAVQN